ncbi:MAG: STAS domain-containing protein [Oscillospiraceae bacterium]|jgi:anti-anti-sigma factor|nr:STAS domain-containing protein [Oscillospiraceae bacterium]
MVTEKITIDQKVEGEQVDIKISGRIDTQTSPKFQNRVNEIFDLEINKVVIDLQGVEYISSAGLRVFLYIKKRLEIKNPEIYLEVKNVIPSVKEIFDITGFSDFLNIV